MFYYNQSYFDWNYTEQPKCTNTAGLDEWCMTETYANATYRGFNYPHHIASYYALYRIARNHDKMAAQLSQKWEWYLIQAAKTVLHMGSARIGYMDGTVQREVSTINSTRIHNTESDDENLVHLSLNLPTLPNCL